MLYWTATASARRPVGCTSRPEPLGIALRKGNLTPVIGPCAESFGIARLPLGRAPQFMPFCVGLSSAHPRLDRRPRRIRQPDQERHGALPTPAQDVADVSLRAAHNPRQLLVRGAGVLEKRFRARVDPLCPPSSHGRYGNARLKTCQRLFARSVANSSIPLISLALEFSDGYNLRHTVSVDWADAARRGSLTDRIRARLNALIDQKKIKQKIFADRLHLTQSAISNMLSGREGRGIDLDYLPALAAAVEVSVSDLVVAPGSRLYELSQPERELLLTFRGLPTDAQQAALVLFRLLPHRPGPAEIVEIVRNLPDPKRRPR